ncbi:restriction endonuclease subunit S [Mycoplasmopsis pulmonis]|uniref:restriction endonuclease subunit S n=1 Tax=Mycoplasmopsis pulmonis TaxID=2107 RepID=UPI002ACE2F67|nr:restriction endonuclease subunit S [Mycoplasmopsis pulmonis]MDZ7293057.1 restriction endonuclease subunit S [Mycoplasmopsis pulmonis]
MAIYKLGQILNLEKGKSKYNAKYVSQNIGIYNLYSSKTKDQGIFGKINSYDFNGEYILITTHGAYAGTVKYVNEKFSTTSNCFILKVNENIVKTKFLSYLLLLQEKTFNDMAIGSAYGYLKNYNINDFEVNLPNLKTQSAIINIIEPLEKLFFNVKNLKIILEKFVSKTYKHSKKRKVNMLKASKISFFNYRNQKLYCPTSLVGKLSLSINKVENISFHNRPSRANLSPLNNSILFSKLVGENKILPISKEEEIVFSTGFFNIQDKNNLNDNLISFLLSEDFVEQKNKYKQGTTMEGINVKNLKMFDIKENVFKGNNIFLLFAALIKLENKLDFLIHKKIINLLI